MKEPKWSDHCAINAYRTKTPEFIGRSSHEHALNVADTSSPCSIVYIEWDVNTTYAKLLFCVFSFSIQGQQ